MAVSASFHDPNEAEIPDMVLSVLNNLEAVTPEIPTIKKNLLTRQGNNIESTLWVAVRTMEERRNLYNKIEGPL